MTDKIYKDYYSELYRFAYFRTNSKEEAEDLVSNTLKKYLENMDNIENPRAWLYSVLRNALKNFYRDSKNNISDADDSIVQFEDEVNYEEVYIEDEIIETIKTSLQEIDPLKSEVILLKVWEEITFKEISSIVDTTIDVVKKRYYRGLEELKLVLKKKDVQRVNSFSLPVLLYGIKRIYELDGFSNKVPISVPKNTNNYFFKNLPVIAFGTVAVLSLFAGTGVIINNQYSNNNKIEQLSETPEEVANEKETIEDTITENEISESEEPIDESQEGKVQNTTGFYSSAVLSDLQFSYDENYWDYIDVKMGEIGVGGGPSMIQGEQAIILVKENKRLVISYQGSTWGGGYPGQYSCHNVTLDDFATIGSSNYGLGRAEMFTETHYIPEIPFYANYINFVFVDSIKGQEILANDIKSYNYWKDLGTDMPMEENPNICWANLPLSFYSKDKFSNGDGTMQFQPAFYFTGVQADELDSEFTQNVYSILSQLDN